MSIDELMRLQNGSDIRGVAVESEQNPVVTLTGEAVELISRAFVRWLSEKTGKKANTLKIGVGHDSRISAPALSVRVLAGIRAEHAAALDCGLASTPSMFMSVVFPETQCDGSIMITASHLPYDRNGLKFFNAAGGLEHEDITALLHSAALLSPAAAGGADAASAAPSTPAEKFDLLSLYAKSLCERIRLGVNSPDDYERPLTGLHIVVDAGNGAGGFFADRVLAPLGADTDGSRYLEPDGMFPAHIPNPENKAAMEAIRSATLESHAELGIIFDTDVDRMSAVLADGTELSRDGIIAMVAAIIASEHPGTTVVTDSVTSDKLTDFLENTLKLRHHRFKRGYKNVINEAKRLDESGIDAQLAIETSGHGALKENYYLDDGAYLAVKLICAAARARREGKSLDALIAGLTSSFESREYRFKISGEGFREYGERVLEAFEQRAHDAGYTVVPDSHEGVRLSFAGEIGGWMLLRLSLHDPLMPLNLEGNGVGDCEKLVETAKRLLKGFDRLDLTSLDLTR